MANCPKCANEMGYGAYCGSCGYRATAGAQQTSAPAERPQPSGSPLPPGAVPPPPTIPGQPASFTPPPGYPGGATHNNYYVTQNVGTNGFAVASFVCAFLCSILGVVFGHVALSQINTSGEKGRGLAIAGLAIGYASLAFSLFYFLGVSE